MIRKTEGVAIDACWVITFVRSSPIVSETDRFATRKTGTEIRNATRIRPGIETSIEAQSMSTRSMPTIPIRREKVLRFMKGGAGARSSPSPPPVGCGRHHPLSQHS
jgi:hypothetical protein